MENERKNIFENGTIWLRADFHLHTIKDREFQPIENPNDFFNQYIERLKDELISIGVITNHNKFDKNEYVNLRKKAHKERILILPGVELSVNDGANGIHCLIVFDNEQWIRNEEDYINQFLTSAFEGIANRENENTRCNYNLIKTLEKLNEHRINGRNSFVVMAHVDQNSGFLNELDGGRKKQFAENELFRCFVSGFHKFRNYEQLTALRAWFANKLPVFVEGSDPKCIQEVGKAHEQNGIAKKTFVKIGAYNFDALRYALSDPEHRVNNEIPKINNSHIQSIYFDWGLLKGKKISFSPELNNLFGIRGSGKSSVLEIIRYVLNIPLGAQAMDKNYKDDLIRHVLQSGGKAVVEIKDRHGDTYTVERIYGQKEDIYKNGALLQGITLDGILKQPIYFGQKDLSNKNADFENDLINKLIGGKLKDIHAKIENQKRTVQRIINELKGLDNLSQLKNDTEKTQANATHQLEIFKEKGVAEKLKTQTSFESDINSLQNRYSGIANYIDDLATLIQKHEYFVNQPISSSVNAELFEEANLLLTDLKGQFERLKIIQTESEKIGVAFMALIEKLSIKREELKEEFAKIKREINIPKLNPDDFIKINRELEISKLKLIEINKSETKRIELTGQLNEAITNLDNLWHERFKLLCDEVSKINQPDGKLAIHIEYKGRKENKKDSNENTFQTKLKEAFKGSNIYDNKYKDIIAVYADFIDIYKDDFRKLNDMLTENQLMEFKNRFQANLFDLLTYQVENEIIIKYEDKPLKDHSLGQRASALILFLLAQKENDILIIDQPEDDLDNQTIYNDVIKEIKRLKGRMQFIFATHNANIPVLGDSEMLIACQYVPDTEILIESGSIDCRNMQEKIIKIMEGGKEAFNRRKTIYNTWERSKV